MKGMYERLYLNDHWGFRPHLTKEMMKAECDWKKLTVVSLPHAPFAMEVPLKGERDLHKICGYRKEFSLGKNYRARHLFLHVTNPAGHLTVYLNGQEIAKAQTGDPELILDVNDILFYDQNNVLIIEANNEDPEDLPFAGLASEVFLEVRGEIIMKQCQMEMGDDCMTTIVVNEVRPNLKLRQKLIEVGRRPRILAEADVTKETTKLSFSLVSYRRWDPTAPALYEVETELLEGGRKVDTIKETVGFTRKEWKDGRFFLNGHRMHLTAVMLPGIFAYLGYQVPGTFPAEDVTRIKKLSCFDAVIASGPCFTEEILDRCDDEGILCLTEEERFSNHASAVILKREELKRLLDQAKVDYDENPAVALGKTLGASDPISVYSWPLTSDYPIRNKPEGTPGIFSVLREERVPKELFLAQADGGLCAQMHLEETAPGYFEPVLYTNASEAEIFLANKSLGVYEANSSYAPGLNHAIIRIPDFRYKMAGMLGRLNERMIKEMEELLPMLKEKGEAGLSRLDKVKLQMLMRRAKLSAEDVASMTQGYYNDFRNVAEDFSALVRQDEEEIRVSMPKRSFDHLYVKARKTALTPGHSYDLTEVVVEARDKEDKLCDRWQGDLAIAAKGRVAVIPGDTMKIRGGRATFYVRSIALTGEGEVRVRRPDVRTEPVVIRFILQE